MESSTLREMQYVGMIFDGRLSLRRDIPELVRQVGTEDLTKEQQAANDVTQKRLHEISIGKDAEVNKGVLILHQFLKVFSSALLNLLSKVVRVFTGYSFWSIDLKDNTEALRVVDLTLISETETKLNDVVFVAKTKEYSLGDKFKNFGIDLLRILATPFFVLAALAAFVYTCINEIEGRGFFIKMCELFEGGRVDRWNKDVDYYELEPSRKIDPKNLFPLSGVK